MTTDRVLRASQDSRLTDSTALTSQNAALRGASLAWKPPVKPKPIIHTYTGNDGAMAAATRAGREGGQRVPGPPNDRFTTPAKPNNTGDSTRLGYQMTGESVGRGSPSPRGNNSSRGSPSRARMGRLDSSGFLQPSGPSAEQRQSPSFIAATLAASRSASVSPNVTGPQKFRADLRPRNDFMRSPSSRRSSSRESSDRVLDTTSIPPTNSLIGIFEQNAKVQKKERGTPIRRTIVAQRDARAPTPPASKRQSQSSPRKLRTPSPSSRRPQSMDITPKGPSYLPAPPPKKPELAVSKPVPREAPEALQHPVPKPIPKPKPQVALPVKAAVKSMPFEQSSSKAQNDHESASSDGSFVSASDNRPTPPPPRQQPNPQRQRLTSASMTSVNSFNTINSMANAIVASSLATSRANSPSKQLLQPPPPPPSRRNGRTHLFHSHHNHTDTSRTPSPSKTALRTTMRKAKPEKESEDEGDKRRSKKHIMKKHPNKHAEGDRKRWRDEVTEREKKRYEGVYASNRGLLLQSVPGGENLVCNLVARDIFSRSRLHVDVLEEVYELVDRGQNGMLEKEEFVVGLWLVDQRLKGRKLPIRVSDHVWRSVGNLKGIKVRKAGK